MNSSRGDRCVRIEKFFGALSSYLPAVLAIFARGILG
jgi:hypothetical protein